MTDLLNGVPSIVIGIFVYTLIVAEGQAFSTYAGGFALGIMMIPIALRSTEEFLRSVPGSMREGAMALGATKSRSIASVVIPAAMRGLISGMMLNLARVAGETAPLLFTALGQPILEPGLEPADRHASGDDLQLCCARHTPTGTVKPGPQGLCCSPWCS